MQTLLYKLNINRDYCTYVTQEVFSQEAINIVRNLISNSNGVPLDKVKIIVADENDKVIHSTPKLDKTEKEMITKRMSYTVKRGV